MEQGGIGKLKHPAMHLGWKQSGNRKEPVSNETDMARDPGEND